MNRAAIMTLGADDLPDPWGEGGLSQLVCGCTCETFHFVLTADTVRAVCSSCKALHGEWPQQAAVATYREELNQPRQAEPPGCRDTLRPQAGAAWGEPPGAPPEPPRPALPAISPAVANVVLSGGPADGQLAWAPGDVTSLWCFGACYQPTGETRGGRRVYQAGPSHDHGGVGSDG